MVTVEDIAFIIENRTKWDALDIPKPVLAFGSRRQRYERAVRLKESLKLCGLTPDDLCAFAQGGAEAVHVVETLDDACHYEAALSPFEQTEDEDLLAIHKASDIVRDKYARAIPVMESYKVPMLPYDETFAILQGAASYPDALPRRAAYLASCYALMSGAGPLPFDPARVARLRNEPARWAKGKLSKRLEGPHLANLRARVDAIFSADGGCLDGAVRRYSRAKSMFIAEIRGVFGAWKNWEGRFVVPGPARRDMGRELVVSYLALMEACRGAAPAVEEAIRCTQLYASVFGADSAVRKMGEPLEVFPLDLKDPNEAKRRKEREVASCSSHDEGEYSYLYGRPLWQIIKEGEEAGGPSSADGDPYYDVMQYDHYRYEPTDFSDSWTK